MTTAALIREQATAEHKSAAREANCFESSGIKARLKAETADAGNIDRLLRQPLMETAMNPNDTPNGVAGYESSLAPNLALPLHESKSRELRLIAQRAVVQAFRSCVDAAIRDRDEDAAQRAHDDLMRAELRLHRMEGFPVADNEGGHQ